MSEAFDDTQEHEISHLHGEERSIFLASHHGWRVVEHLIPSVWKSESVPFSPAELEAVKRIARILESYRSSNQLGGRVVAQETTAANQSSQHHPDHGESKRGVGQLEQLRMERDRLREERDKAYTQIELLESRVAELRRHAARETHRYDQILAGHNTTLERCNRDRQLIDKLVETLVERGKANDCLLSAFIERPGSRIRMHQSYEGKVKSVYEGQIVVIYNVDGDVVEQIYETDQFIDGHLPCEGDRLAVFVIVAEVHPKSIAAPEEPIQSDEHAIPLRESLSGPTEF